MTDDVREAVGKLVTDVSELKTAHALISQAHSEYQNRITEFMLRNDRGHAEMSAKLDRLVRSDYEWAGARRAFAIGGKMLVGLAAIATAVAAYLGFRPH